MFIGHYGVALAAKPVRKTIPLWMLFVAVQWLDFMWAILVMLGVEKVRIVKNFTEGSSLDLYYMPFTHGLLGAIGLSLVFAAVCGLFLRDRSTATFAVLAGAVFSHWLLDLVVHIPDLPLVGDSMKVGFGLWRHLWISFPLEIATLFVGAFAYAVFMPATSRRGAVWYWSFVVLMAGTEFYAAFGPDPATPAAAAQTALGGYIALALAAAVVDRIRNNPQAAAAATNVKRLDIQPISG